MAKHKSTRSRPQRAAHSEEAHSRPGRGRPMWSGSISFGLVTIPVKLYSGIRPKDIRLHMLHAPGKARLQEKLFCPVEQEDLEFPGSKPHLRDAEVKIALQLLQSLESDFDPKTLHDDYRDQMLQLIQKKAEGQEIVTAPSAAEEQPQVIDLMDALKKSVAEAQRHRTGRRAA